MTLRIFFFAAFLLNYAYAETVTSLTGSFKNGQVFLTWTNVSNKASLYKVYRSTAPIASAADLAACEYLGYVNNLAAKDFNLSNYDLETRYLRIDSGGTPLDASTGLFVATTLENGNYYYAVTTLNGTAENTTIVAGGNSLETSIAETVMPPQPIYQETRFIGGVPVEIWATFQSSRYAADKPLLLSWGFYAHSISLNRSNNSYSNPMKITYHGGGATFMDDIAVNPDGEVKMNLEDWFPDSTISAGYWGSNPAYDIFNSENNVAPTTGVNVNYSQLLLSRTIDWAINHLAFDTNRITLYASSNGAPGAFLYAITYPDKLASVDLHVGAFDFGFQNDYNPNCSLNTGKKNRREGDKRFGTVETNLDCSLGEKTYDMLNGGYVIHKYPDRDYPFIFSVNGKQDKQVGWTEKTIWYDSLNNNHFPGWYFWDNRDHGGKTGVTWSNANFDAFRYRRNVSFPAINNCSLNEDFGNGTGDDGESFGSVNGAVDWNDNVTDNSTSWSVKVFVRDLIKYNQSLKVYPDSCTADVTPRRRQSFKPAVGSTIDYVVTHLGKSIQSGSFIYQGGLMTIPSVKIFRDTSVITLTIPTLQTFYLDQDSDGFGNSTDSMQAFTEPAGYVANAADCNDTDRIVNPAADDLCNGIDDNCDGFVDENAVVVTIYSTGDTTVCQPNMVSLSSASTGLPEVYQWMMNGEAIPGATNSTYAATVSGNYSLQVSNNFCQDTAASILATINPLPAMTVSPSGEVTECKGTKITLTTLSVAGNAYQWLKGGVAIAGATSTVYKTGKNETGSFSVKVQNTDECISTSPETIISRLTQPAAVITAMGNMDICEDDTVTLLASSGAGYTYQWKKDGKKISGATNQQYAATSAGAYKVTVTDANGCSKTAKAVTVANSCKSTTAEIGDDESELIVQPVPSNGQFKMMLTNCSSGKEGELLVLDVMGNEVYSRKIIFTSSTFDAEINLDKELYDGVFFVEVICEEKKWVKMITVIKNHR